MRTDVPANPFPDVALSADDKRVMISAVDLLLQDALAQYEAHLTEDRGVVPERLWKLVKSRDGVSVYRKRRTTPRASESPKVHTILAIGSVPGSVDDFLLGLVNPSMAAAAAYSKYIFKGSVSGAATLATIVGPSRKSPDRTVAIKWDAHGALYPLNKVFRTRDFVTAEATGSTINWMGERIAYHLLHSVDVAGAPELQEFGYIRATKFFAFLYRQSSPDKVDVYCTGRIDTKGDVPTGITTRASADGLADIILRTKSFSNIKKKTWWLRYHATSAGTAGMAPPVGNACGVCSKHISGIMSALSRTCAACSRRICSSRTCGGSKKVIYTTGSDNSRGAFDMSHSSKSHSSKSSSGHSSGGGDRAEFSLRKTTLCSHCLAAALHLNAWEIAASDAGRNHDVPSDTADEGTTPGSLASANPRTKFQRGRETTISNPNL